MKYFYASTIIKALRRIFMLLRQIEYLQAVIENGNFYLAGEQCNVSQSAISQQIKKLEEELGVTLLERHNRTFTLTPAGEHFYRKSLIISGDIEQLIRETKKISDNTNVTLRLGCYRGYNGTELSTAISLFSEKYPTIDIEITIGSHEELYKAMENDLIDLALNDQRRAFSDAYNNLILSESNIYIEISTKNPLSKLDKLEASDLKNLPCILVANQAGRSEEQLYYEEIVGIRREFIFVDSLQEARLKIITEQGYMPVDIIGEQVWFDTTINRIPLYRKNTPISKTYCAFWKRDIQKSYVDEFATFLSEQF